MRTNGDLYQGSIFLLLLSAIFLFAGWLHLQPKFRPSLSWFKDAESRLNHHLAGLFGFSSIAWTGHLVHVAIPESRGQHVGWDNFLSVMPHPAGLLPFFTGNWGVYAQSPDTVNHVFGTSEGAGTAILTFLGGFHPQTQSLWLTDMAHHHLAIGVIFVFAGHMYRTQFGIGHSIKDILNAHRPPSGRLGKGHEGLYDTLNNSLHFQLALALACLGVVTSLVAQHMYALPPYAFIAQDYTTQAALYTHHQYIATFIMCGAFAHGAIFLVRDYDPAANAGNVLDRVLQHKEAIISHLSWVSLFLGFHTLGLYVHNDVVVAFGTPEKQILVEPVFAQFVQAASGKALYGFDVLLANADSAATAAASGIWLPNWLDAVNAGTNALFLPIGPGDFLVHHAIALGLHTTTLILVKGALDARGSKLMPDKKDFGYSFPCDGPGRGGTCDISAWDAFYLAVFWALNTVGWVTFYWHWKNLSAWQGNLAQFNESSTYLMGWLRDYLWLNSAQLINGYNPFGTSNLSVWAWMFLFGHLVWATGFMFLISWRGYWQELIETIVWAHQRTPLANLVGWKDKPVALSIVQARVVGLAHFSVGYVLTYAAFLIASTAGKFG
jgi:photosystem I P700 chlorophyll a apoprotein A2